MVVSRRRSDRPRRPLTGRVVAITGGARGLGLAMAQAVAGRGARVAIGDLDYELAAAEAAKLPQGCVGLPLDVTDPAAFKSFLDTTEERLGLLDVLVNNAGIMVVSPFLEEQESLTRRQIDINLHGVITGMRLALPGMQERRTGHVVNVASVAGKVSVAGEAVYVATKHAVVGLSDAVRLELRGTGVELSVMIPGLANTELASGMSAGRGVKLVEPDEVASALVDALERPRFEIYVPRRLSALLRIHAVLPQAASDAMARFFETDQVAMKVDKTARAAYAARASAGMPPAEPPAPPSTEPEAGATEVEVQRP